MQGKRKGHSGAHKGVASWNAPGYTTEGKAPARNYSRNRCPTKKDNAMPG